MGEQKSDKIKKHICAGLLAHVDAGKTTLSEAILYLAGAIRKLGRVDDRDAFLDTYELERARGITIFSKQAVFSLEDTSVTLLDTPGHVDFSAEMERTLQVLDCAILVINGADGVQGHMETLWRLLKRYRIPVCVFLSIKWISRGRRKRRLWQNLRAAWMRPAWILAAGRRKAVHGIPKQRSQRALRKVWLSAMKLYWKHTWNPESFRRIQQRA